MEIIILGTSAAFAGKNEGCSSYLLLVNKKPYLIDTGPGCVSYLQNYIGYREVKGIFCSHLHADHISDIYTLRYAIYVAQRDGYMDPPLPIYMPRSPKKTFRFIRSSIKKEFSINEITESLKLDLEGINVSFKKTRHPVDTYAMRFETGKKSIVYTSDTMFFEELIHFSRNADLLLAEATLQNRDKNFETLGHMTAETAGILAQEAQAKRLVLTHIWPDYEWNISVEEAKKSFHGELILGQRGKLLKI